MRYRQRILQDSLKNPAIVREMYDVAVQAIEQEKKTYWDFFSKYPAAILSRAIEVLRGFVVALRRLRAIAEELGGEFESEGFQTLFAMLRRELSDAYFAEIEAHLRALRAPSSDHCESRATAERGLSGA